MSSQPIFAGLVVDEFDRPVETATVGGEAMYVVNDMGFRRHIPAEQVDRQVLREMTDQIKGHEDVLSEQTAKMLGQDDIFSKAMIQNQLKNIEQQIDQILNMGLPEESRAYMGMLGFKIMINVHGEVLKIQQPGGIAGEEGEGE